MSIEVKPTDLIAEVMVKVIDGTHRLMLVENDEPPDVDREGLRNTLDLHIMRAREYGSNISTEDARQRYGREQGLQELRVALFDERLP